ncbi:MAG: hypothetical protein D3920_17315, partial [Candidatus Electrothrix sp. AW2]|nr:hypothetical protein [Candidatus Electrothrix gigas]
HATHQFFLSKRSLYVLVLDSRKDERTEYWLRHVETFGGDSPVLVVLNKIDNNASFDVNRPFLLEKYPGIRDFFRISCKTGKGVSAFKTALQEELAAVEMIGTVWPGTWFAVKRKLEEMDKPYISVEEYRGYCAAAGITGKESREILADFLHDLGVAVHFRELDLKSMHVLDPVWVTEAVYKIITAEEMADSKGILHLNALEEILKEQPVPLTERTLSWIGRPARKRYCCPQETHPFIMRLMQKFELCYPVGKEAVLIPQLLPVSEPELAFTKTAHCASPSIILTSCRPRSFPASWSRCIGIFMMRPAGAPAYCWRTSGAGHRPWSRRIWRRDGSISGCMARPQGSICTISAIC